MCYVFYQSQISWALFFSHDQIFFLFFFDYTIDYDKKFFFSNDGESHSIILWLFIYFIFQYDMNQNKFFIVIKTKVFVHTSSHNTHLSS